MDRNPKDTPFLVQVHLFARARELAGSETVAVELSPGADVSQLRNALADHVPALRLLLPSAKIAINHDFAGDHCTIGPTDEVALIPPVSGG